MPSSSYDVAVLGDELSGLVAATLCASRGLRVLLLESGAPPGKYTIGEYQFSAEPAPIVGISTPPVNRVLSELHFQHALRRKMIDIDTPPALVGPDQRVSLYSDPLKFAREFQRELPNEATEPFLRAAEETRDSVETLLELDEPSGVGFRERREFTKAKSTLRRLESDLEHQQTKTAAPLARAPAALSCRMLATDTSWIACAQMLSQWRAGTNRIEGDWDGFRALFLAKLHSHNGEVRKCDSFEIATHWKRVTSIRLLGGEEIAAQQLIAAMPIGELAASFRGKMPRQIRELDQTVELSGYRYTLNLIIDQRVIPEGMPPIVVAVADVAASLDGGNVMSIYRSPADSNGRVQLALQATTSAATDSSLPAQFADLRRRMLKRLEEIMPFSAEAIELVHSPNESSHAVGLKQEIGVVSAPPLWRARSRTPIALQALPTRSGVKNLSIASSQVFPALGLSGELMAAWNSAAYACAPFLGRKRREHTGDV